MMRFLTNSGNASSELLQEGGPISSKISFLTLSDGKPMGGFIRSYYVRSSDTAIPVDANTFCVF